MEFELGSTELTEARRLLSRAAPHVRATDLADALARGLGFPAYARLTERGRVRAGVDRLAFEASLAERGYVPARLQVALLEDAVRLAAGVPWTLPGPRPAGTRLERCNGCRDDFWSEGWHNLLCAACKLRFGRVMGVHHADYVCDQIVYGAFHKGDVPDYVGNPLRARPGWADLLDGDTLRARVETWLGYREAVRAHRWDDLPDGQRFLIDRFGEASYLRLFHWGPNYQHKRAA